MVDPVSKDDFKAVMSRFASGVTIVTTTDESGSPWGLTVSAFSSLSMDPPLCLVCIDRKAGSHHALLESRSFAVNILSDQQDELSNRFASSRDDKFADVDWQKGPVTGCPILSGVLAWTECEVTDVFSGGDHDIFLGELKKIELSDGKPLLYFDGAYGDITSRPKAW